MWFAYRYIMASLLKKVGLAALVSLYSITTPLNVSGLELNLSSESFLKSSIKNKNELACSHSKRKSDYIVENMGNPKQGTIYFLKQSHYGELVEKKLRKISGRRFESIKKIFIEGISKSQNAILEELVSLNIDNLFVENMPKSNRTELLYCFDFSSDLCKIDNQYKKGFPKNPTYLDDQNLCRFGAGVIYSIFNHNIKFHDLLPTNKIKEINQKLDECNLDFKNHHKLIYDEREKLLITQFKKYFNNHPGDSVVLVYGSSHNIKKYIDDKFNPRLISIDLSLDYKKYFNQFKNNK